MSQCNCGDDSCPRCYRDIYYQQRREYDDATVDDRTDRLLNEMERDNDSEN